MLQSAVKPSRFKTDGKLLVHDAGRVQSLGLTLHFSSVPTDLAVINGKEAPFGVI